MSAATWRASSAIWSRPACGSAREKASQKVKARATVLAEERIIDLILHPNRKPVNPIDVLLGNKPKQPELPAEEKQRIAQKADELRAQLQRGELEGHGDRSRGGGRAEGRGDQRREREHRLDDGRHDAQKTKMRRMKVADARRLLVAGEGG